MLQSSPVTKPQGSQESATLRNSVVKHMDMQHKERCKETLKSLAVQVRNLELAAAATTDLIWKRYLYDMSAGTKKFLLNAAINTLPTEENLQR